MIKGGTKLTTEEIDSYIMEYLQEPNYSLVARKFNKSPITVRKAITRFREKNPEEWNKIYSTYLQNREEAFIIKSTNSIDKAIDKINEQIEVGDNTIAQLSTTLGILYDKRQLSTGKSTNNNQVIIKMSSELEDLSK